MHDEKFLQVVRAAIGVKNIPKKILAKRCKTSKPRFSEMLHGDREMPKEVQEILIAELGLKKIWAKLSAVAWGLD